MNKGLILSVLSLALLASLARPVVAQDAPDAARNKAAMDLLLAMKMDSVMDNAVKEMLDQQIAANPVIAQHKQVMVDFMNKYISWAALKEDLAKIYAEEFTESELKEITAFYKSPTGQKVADKLPVLTSKGMELGQRRVQEHLPELQQAIMKSAQNQQQPQQ